MLCLKALSASITKFLIIASFAESLLLIISLNLLFFCSKVKPLVCITTNTSFATSLTFSGGTRPLFAIFSFMSIMHITRPYLSCKRDIVSKNFSTASESARPSETFLIVTAFVPIPVVLSVVVLPINIDRNDTVIVFAAAVLFAAEKPASTEPTLEPPIGTGETASLITPSVSFTEVTLNVMSACVGNNPVANCVPFERTSALCMFTKPCPSEVIAVSKGTGSGDLHPANITTLQPKLRYIVFFIFLSSLSAIKSIKANLDF